MFRSIFQRRRPKNEDNPVYKGGPRPPRGMQPPIIIHDMRAMERNREENFREARRREGERLQGEARQEARRWNPQPQRQSTHDRDLGSSVGIDVFPEQARNNSQREKLYCQPYESNISAQGTAEHRPRKEAALKSRFETPQEGQSNDNKKRSGFPTRKSDREGIYAEIDETRMVEFESPEQRHDTITRTVVYV